VILPALFTDHMVLQRDAEDRVWGWAEPAEQITVKIADQEHSTTADESGRWEVKLVPLPAGGPHTIEIFGKNKLTINDVLVGEVWVCSGQSNMEWPVEATNDGDLEQLLPEDTQIRFITVPHVGTQEAQKDFQGKWEICTPDSMKQFSGVGYFFGKQLADTLNVPVGLIDDSWGGSACEAWIDRKVLADHEKFKGLVDAWGEFEKTYSHEDELKQYEEQKKAWEASDKKSPAPWPWPPGDQMEGNARPGNLYRGMILPVAGYGIRGAIWYQGETNAGRSYQYRKMFPLMIQNWRDVWRIGDFPFYWVQLADFMGESNEPKESGWAELREAQTLTLDKLPNVGQAVIIDIGEGKDIHPRNKRDVGLRLARIALARDYGKDVIAAGPRYKSLEVKDGKAIVTFDIGTQQLGKLRPFDVDEPTGFAVAGVDRKFVPAHAKLLWPDRVEVWSEQISEPVAVRYAWADNPVCNLKNDAGLPAVPFRTDDWPGITAEAELPPQVMAK
jgi:sialate O-acetylesterase